MAKEYDIKGCLRLGKAPDALSEMEEPEMMDTPPIQITKIVKPLSEIR